MKKLIFAIIITFLITCSAFAGDILVNTPVNNANIQIALDTASAGDRVLVPDGSYTGIGNIDTNGTNGSLGNEIIFRPVTLGGVTFDGNFELLVNGDYWIVQGFDFDGATSGDGQAIITIDDADNVGITNNSFVDSGHPYAVGEKGFVVWVRELADNCEIDYNTFDNPLGIAVIIKKNADGDTNPTSAHVHHNDFKNIQDYRTSHAGQDWPAIFLGKDLDQQYDNYASIVEYNLFDLCQGDPENITVKSSGNIIQYNVMSDSQGISLRTGATNEVTYNTQYGTGAQTSRGISVHNGDHTLTNNCCKDLDRDAFVLWSGDGNDEPVYNTELSGNSVFGQADKDALRISRNTYTVEDVTTVTIERNIFQAKAGADELIENEGYTDEGSLTWGTGADANQVDKGPLANYYTGFTTDPTGQIEGTYTGNDNCTLHVTSDDVGVDWDIPVKSNLQPTGTLICSSDPRNVTFSLNTNETANCRSGTTNAGSYDALPDEVTNTDSTSHSWVENLACDASYSRFVACADPVGNESTVSEISFSIESGSPPPEVREGTLIGVTDPGSSINPYPENGEFLNETSCNIKVSNAGDYFFELDIDGDGIPDDISKYHGAKITITSGASSIVGWGGLGDTGNAFSADYFDQETLGSELVTNGDFASDISGWGNLGGNEYDTLEWSSGSLHAVSDGSATAVAGSDDNVSLVAGTAYRIDYDITISSGEVTHIGCRSSLGTGAIQGTLGIIDTTDSYTSYFIASATEDTSFVFFSSSAVDFLIDNISVKEVTQGAKGGFREITLLGSEAISGSGNTDFANASINDWVIYNDSTDSTVTYSNANLDGPDDKQGLITVDETTDPCTFAYAELPTTKVSFTANQLHKVSVKVHTPAANTLQDVHITVGDLVGAIVAGKSITTLADDTYTTIEEWIYVAADTTGSLRVGFSGDPADGDLLYFDDNSVKIVDISHVPFGTNTLDLANAGVSNESLTITYSDNNAGALLYFRDSDDLSSNLISGRHYLYQFQGKVGVGDTIQHRVGEGSTELAITSNIAESFTSYNLNFVAESTNNTNILMKFMGIGEEISLDNLVLRHQTNVSVFGIRIENGQYSGVEGWESVDGGFDWNDQGNYTVVISYD